MLLQAVDRVDSIEPSRFRKQYYDVGKPLIIKDLAKSWPASTKWTWEYFMQVVGDEMVGVYNNVKSDSYTPVNAADAYMKFGDYLKQASSGPLDLRIFLFNIFQHAPELVKDFTWPDELLPGIIKRYPMLFVGGQGSITHMHFDIDMSHILHTQFVGKKKVLLFPYSERHKLYRKPWEVLSLADYAHYSEGFDYENFPAVKYARGYEVELSAGETLYMPAGFFHHMEYLEAGYAMSLRAMQSGLGGKLEGLWKLAGMRSLDTLFKKTIPRQWYNYKKKSVYKNADIAMKVSTN
ncbi:MAG: cupin-like domain-containing protein [Ferruginibacter sp.]